MDMEQIAAALAEHGESIKNLQGWQKRQNGSLLKIEEKIDRMDEKFNERFNSLYFWLVGLMGGVIASLFLLVTKGG